MSLVSIHRPDLAVPPRWMRRRMPPRSTPHTFPSQPRPRLHAAGISLWAGVCQRRQVRSGTPITAQNLVVGMPASSADHLEVREGPSRPSADFFHTRSSTAASPSARVRSATSASSCCSRVEGPERPAAVRPLLPASRNCRFHVPDRLLGHPRPLRRFGDGELTGENDRRHRVRHDGLGRLVQQQTTAQRPRLHPHPKSSKRPTTLNQRHSNRSSRQHEAGNEPVAVHRSRYARSWDDLSTSLLGRGRRTLHRG